ncbi:MAG: hypothetical protein Q9227_008375 [Pyrenula ochraceoflavens]
MPVKSSYSDQWRKVSDIQMQNYAFAQAQKSQKYNWTNEPIHKLFSNTNLTSTSEQPPQKELVRRPILKNSAPGTGVSKEKTTSDAAAVGKSTSKVTYRRAEEFFEDPTTVDSKASDTGARFTNTSTIPQGSSHHHNTRKRSASTDIQPNPRKLSRPKDSDIEKDKWVCLDGNWYFKVLARTIGAKCDKCGSFGHTTEQHGQFNLHYYGTTRPCQSIKEQDPHEVVRAAHSGGGQNSAAPMTDPQELVGNKRKTSTSNRVRFASPQIMGEPSPEEPLAHEWEQTTEQIIQSFAYLVGWNYVERINARKEVLHQQAVIKRTCTPGSDEMHAAYVDIDRTKLGIHNVYKEFWAQLQQISPGLITPASIQLAQKVGLVLRSSTRN